MLDNIDELFKLIEELDQRLENVDWELLRKIDEDMVG